MGIEQGKSYIFFRDLISEVRVRYFSGSKPPG